MPTVIDIHSFEWPVHENVYIGQSSQLRTFRNVPVITRFGEVALVIINGYMAVLNAPEGIVSRIVFHFTFNNIDNPDWTFNLKNAYYHRIYKPFIVALPIDRDISVKIIPELVSTPSLPAIVIRQGFNMRVFTDQAPLTAQEISEFTTEDRNMLQNAGYI